MKGRLKDRPLELILQEIQARMPSGVLTLTSGATVKQICFLKGTVRFAASNQTEDRLAEFLIRTGALPVAGSSRCSYAGSADASGRR